MITLASILLTVTAFIVKDHFIQGVSISAAAVLLVLLSQRSKRLSRSLFWYAFFTHLTAWYWLPDTLKTFGGFPGWVALALHVLFAVTAAIQFWLVGVIYDRVRRFDPRGSRAGIYLFPVVWGLVDLIFPQLFPWTLADPLIWFANFSSLAEICGVTVLSAALLFYAEVFVRLCRKERPYFGAAAVCLFCVLGTVLASRADGRLQAAPRVQIGLIQGNIGLKEKADPDELANSLHDYALLSRQAIAAGAKLLIWPETVMTRWTPADLPTVHGTEFDPAPDLGVPLLYGNLRYTRGPGGKPLMFNGGNLLDSEGRIRGGYDKRVLMPFGEFLPFERFFPALRTFSPTSGDFASGLSSAPLTLEASGQAVKIVPLICYEDLVPSLAAEGAALGGNIFVNMTNDAWYGDTAAPWQHLLLAQWRSIEMRRTLLRATNTGITTAVLPDGRLDGTLPTFDRGFLVVEAPLLEGQTVYSQLGDGPFTVLLSLILLGRIVVAMKRKD